MGLVGPGDVGGSDQDDGYPSFSRRLHQFMDCPVFQHEAQDEHQEPEGVVDEARSHGFLARLCPHPLQHQHG